MSVLHLQGLANQAQAELDNQLTLVGQRRRDWYAIREQVDAIWSRYRRAEAEQRKQLFEEYLAVQHRADSAWFLLERSRRVADELFVAAQQAWLSLRRAAAWAC